jgi:hypothetical protein
MHRALHLGVQKALGVVASHYQVDFEAVSTGYVVPDSVDEETAMNRADALAAPAADVLAEDFIDFLFPDAPVAGGPKPEDHWAFVPFKFSVLAFELCGLCNKQLWFKTFECLRIKAVVCSSGNCTIPPPDFLR